jgi:hypothetical protein
MKNIIIPTDADYRARLHALVKSAKEELALENIEDKNAAQS